MRAFSDAAPSPSEGISDGANPVGRYYHDLVYRGRGHNALKLGDLRKLMQMCDSPELARYSLQAMHLFQRKGQDFSEEVNSHFVRSVAVDGKQAVVAAKVMAKWRNRIGAWSTTTSLEKLLLALVDQGPYESSVAEDEGNGVQEDASDIAALVVELLEVSFKKGVFMSKAVFEAAIKLVPEQSAETTADTGLSVTEAAGEGDNIDISDEEGDSDSSSDSEGASSSSSSSDDEDGGEASVAKKHASLRDRLRAVATRALGEEEASDLFA